MAEYITMPRFSDTMEEGTVIKWHKTVGENILEGDLLASIESDKSIQELESEFNGYLLYIEIPEGKSAKVNSLIAIIGESKNLDIENIRSLYSNKKKNIIPIETYDSNKKKNIIPIETYDSNKRLLISPLAKIMAKNQSISLEDIKGSGINGRIIKRDIENYQMEINKKIYATSIEKTLKVSILTSNEIINSSIRKVFAKRLAESKFTAPHYYLMISIDMKNSIKSRLILNKNLKVEEKITFNDLIIKAAALSLKINTKINSSWKNDKTIYHNNINIGVVVAVEDGLLVPVVKNADQKTLLQISLEVKDKARKARNSKISLEEMEDSTFTISNLGMFGIESFTSIINQPNSCILSVGAIIEKPIIKNGIVIIGNIMKISLACDHRLVDGNIGSTFLQGIKRFLEDPITMLM